MISTSDQQYGVVTGREPASNIVEDRALSRLATDMPLLVLLINFLSVARAASFLAELPAAFEYEMTRLPRLDYPNDAANAIPVDPLFPHEYALGHAREVIGMNGNTGASDPAVLCPDSKSLLPTVDYPSATSPEQ